MHASEIRSRFLDFFARHQHVVLPSSPLVPADDPTLLFTNAGMVQFKKVFLGLEAPSGGRRATTSQKCVRAGGKHNDLEQVGHTARHHTFFEMLGNFSFGDYFKREAIGFAWDFVTGELGIDARHLRVTVYSADDEARALWKDVAGLDDARIYGLGERDNFWQMAETGPCGPCSEIYVDLAHVAGDWRFPEGASGEWTDVRRTEFSQDSFVDGAEAGRFLEIWNLVFMQYDRAADGTLTPLPRPSIDTGAGLERIAAALQGVTNNYHTDLFTPLIGTVSDVTGVPYEGRLPVRTRPDVDPASFRVLADHGRAVAFLLADGVYPSNEGRGYVLRRILRRAVRHAWLLGRREPTLVHVVHAVVQQMGDIYPELRHRAQHLTTTTALEEERFLDTIDGGMQRFEQLAPTSSTQGSTAVRGTISGEDAFRLYDTFGFPIDLTGLMARERGYTVDIAGFERALQAQRERSREDRRGRDLSLGGDELAELTKSVDGVDWDSLTFVGYDALEIETQVVAARHLADGRVALFLRETPFYSESGGQVSDRGEVVGEGWRIEVEDVRKFDGRVAVIGRVEGRFAFGRAVARVPSDRRRDTERNHTATHLLHAALRRVLGDAAHQAGSLVAPDRLRFDFTHHGPVSADRLAEIEGLVNRWIVTAVDVRFEQLPYKEALSRGAIALFGEKYGESVRVVTVPGISAELCGGTHVRNTGLIGLFKIISETGVASGVRRIEALTGSGAYEFVRAEERTLHRLAELLRTPADNVAKRVESLLEERRALQRRLEETLRGGGDQLQQLLARAASVNGSRIVASMVTVADVKELQALGDALREQLGSGVGVLGATCGEGKPTLLVVVTDNLRERGVRADAIVRELAAGVGGRGGGKPHMAQAGIPDSAGVQAAVDRATEVVRKFLDGAP